MRGPEIICIYGLPLANRRVDSDETLRRIPLFRNLVHTYIWYKNLCEDGTTKPCLDHSSTEAIRRRHKPLSTPRNIIAPALWALYARIYEEDWAVECKSYNTSSLKAKPDLFQLQLYCFQGPIRRYDDDDRGGA